MNDDLAKKLATTAFAFRGYNVTNLGRSPELLGHATYGPTVERILREASEVCSEAIGRRVDLVDRVRQRRETTLQSFAEDVSMIVAMSMSQIELLDRFFAIPVREAKLSFGYSIGELNALLLGGVFEMQDILPVPLRCAEDCAELAEDVSMGVLFSRGPVLVLDEVLRLCAEISVGGDGIIAPSAYIAPNAMLLLAQNDALDRFQKALKGWAERTHLRRNPHKWPPLHTPLLWSKNVPNRSGLALFDTAGGLTAPNPQVVSCVTGKASYNDFNSREHLVRWVDHPQLLWDVIYETLVSGIETFIHVGPEPNLIPATYARISNNVSEQLGSRYVAGIGNRVVSRIYKHPWLANLLSSKSALLRTPFVEHIILENWLLEHQPE